MGARPRPGLNGWILGIYNVLFLPVLLILLPGLIRRLVRRGNYREKFGQRFGLYSQTDRQRLSAGKWVWVHSISVGETLVALKLARALRARDAELKVFLSVTTSTGFALARQSAPDWLEVAYNPVDAPWVVARVLDLVRPVGLVLIEGELWPNLLAAAVRRGIPVSLANARMSPRSERRFLRFKPMVGWLFAALESVCVAEPEDVERWRRLGAGNVVRTGSIKFDLAVVGNADADLEKTEALRELLRPFCREGQQRFCLVAGSTWAPEERVLGLAFKRLSAEVPGILLVLVPRHVERAGELERELTALGLAVVRRSLLPGEGAPARCDVLLVDTTGELRHWYALADMVFVGKSLPGIREVGGQNPAEPAALGKAVVFGPHMENFEAVVTGLLRNRAAVRVVDAEKLVDELVRLAGAVEERGEMGMRAITVRAPHQGATERTALQVAGGFQWMDR